MKAWLAGAAAAMGLFSLAVEAQAQPNAGVVGTWSFQTADFAPEPQYTAAISGTIVVHRPRRGVHQVNMFAIQLDVDNASGDWSTTETRENCTGTLQDTHFSISCEVVNSSGGEGYAPDNFELDLDGPGRMTGALASSSSADAVFRRLD